MERPARPVLKWAGGKSRSLSPILERLPERIGTYYEPFVGGAAVFFSLAAAGRFKRAVLGDRNADLIGVYLAVQRDVEALIGVLSSYRNERDEYYRIRALDTDRLDPVERAARTIYLNKTGYNGLYRVNRQGRFNVPFGRHQNPKICDSENLRAAAAILKRTRIVVADFEQTALKAKAGDAVYFDPPYMPVSRTASFTAYHSDPFGLTEHDRLARVFGELGERGITAVLSNSDTPHTRKLYRPWQVKRIAVSRPINSKVGGRGEVAELLVINQRR
jgi:DNA adenine methylase